VITADEMIEAYVGDVVLLLPRRQRRDVAQELRALLGEEIDGAVGADPQRASREDAARAVLVGFGRPAEVAARYGPPATLIDPADTRQFVLLALSGAALIALAAAFDSVLHGAQRDGAAVLVLAWWGVLAAAFAALAWVRRRGWQRAWTPHVISDRISRPGRAVGLVLFALGTLVLASPQLLIRRITGGGATPALYDAFAYDSDFLRVRGPVVLALLVLGLGIQAVLVIQGRWRPWLHSTEMVYSLVLCAVLTSVFVAGPIFSAVPTDQSARGAIALIILVTLADLAVRLRRYHVLQAVRGAAHTG
jgi:hypothetical protein